MSLEFTIELIDAREGAAEALASQSWRPALRVRVAHGKLYVDGAHEALTEDADWSAPTWSMAPARLEGIGELLTASHDSSAGLLVSALWAGESARITEPISLGSLLDRIKNSQMGTKTTYLVEKKS